MLNHVCVCVLVCVCAYVYVCIYIRTAVSRGKAIFLCTALQRIPPIPPISLTLFLGRGNQLGVAGWAAVSGGLEGLRCLTRLNGCDQYGAIRKGGLKELTLGPVWELGVWAAGFLGRSESTLTRLDVRCAAS